MSKQSVEDVAKIIQVIANLVSALKGLFGSCSSLPKEDEQKKK